jgi:hypothetical protein
MIWITFRTDLLVKMRFKFLQMSFPGFVVPLRYIETVDNQPNLRRDAQLKCRPAGNRVNSRMHSSHSTTHPCEVHQVGCNSAVALQNLRTVMLQYNFILLKLRNHFGLLLAPCAQFGIRKQLCFPKLEDYSLS